MLLCTPIMPLPSLSCEPSNICSYCLLGFTAPVLCLRSANEASSDRPPCLLIRDSPYHMYALGYGNHQEYAHAFCKKVPLGLFDFATQSKAMRNTQVWFFP